MSRGPRRGSPKRRPKGHAFNAQTLEVDVHTVGGRGDGVAAGPERPLYIPYTVPGDRVRVRTTGPQGDGFAAVTEALLSPGPDRAEPICRHFGACGGCALQHLSRPAYDAWKRDQVVQALARRGLDVAVDLLQGVPLASRRRVAWAAAGGTVGFTQRASHRIVGIEQCPLLVDGLNDLLARLSAVAGGLGGIRQIQATWADNGADVLVTGPADLDRAARERLAAFTDEADLARLSWRADDETEAEPVALRRVPVVGLSGIPLAFSPGAFLQPSAEGERLLAAPVAEWLAGASAVADLFAGLGTFTCALLNAGQARIHAVESEGEALAALSQAAGRAGFGGRVSVETRDLFHRPLTPAELKRFDAVIFDPPRAGAREQAESIAQSGVRRVAAVSCNPATFARDIRALVDGGFDLVRVVPVDQFPFAAHVEVVALLTRQVG